jgi:hypothetical protein
LAGLDQFEGLVNFQQMAGRLNAAMATFGLATNDAMKQQTMVVFLFSSIVVLTAFLAYHGQDTLSFKFKDPAGIPGAIFGFMAGAVNGYLIAGTIWYYLDQSGYPIQQYPWFEATFTALAINLIRFLPQYLFSGLVLSGLALVLLWWRILK